MWLILTLAVTVKTVLSPRNRTVYPKMAARSLAWWSGQDLYEKYGDLGRFPYSPTFAISLTPFAILGDRAGAVLWSWLNIAAYVWGLRRLVRDVLPGAWPPQREAVLLMLAMIGALRGFWNAQSNALIIGMLMGGVSALVRRRWWEVACLLGGPVFMKLWAAVLLLLMAALRPKPLVPRLLAVLAIGAALPFVTQVPGFVLDQYRDWFAFLVDMSADVLISYRDLWTILQTAELAVPESLYRATQLVTAGAVLGWCLWLQRTGRSARELFIGTLAAGAAWVMIFGPAVEYNTYVVLAPMVTWAVLESLEVRRGRALAVTAFIMTMVLGSGEGERTLRPLFPAALGMLPAGTTVFVVWLLIYGRGSGGRFKSQGSASSAPGPTAGAEAFEHG